MAKLAPEQEQLEEDEDANVRIDTEYGSEVSPML